MSFRVHHASRSAAGGWHPDKAVLVGLRGPEQDERWPALAAALAALHDAGRRSVRIVDADCGAGGLLLRACRHARAMGFTAIEGRGIDGVPALVRRARTAAERLADPAIGVSFDLIDLATALAEEADAPADILLWHDRGDAADRSAPVRTAGRVVIGDPA